MVSPLLCAADLHRGPKCIVYSANVSYDDLSPRVMAGLRKRYGTRFILLVASEQRKEALQKWLEPGDKVFSATDLERDVDFSPSEAEVFEAARANESIYQVNYLRDIILQDRGNATYFLDSAPYSPFALFKPHSIVRQYAQLNHYFNSWADLLQREAVDMVLVRTGALLETSLVHVAIARGIPVSFAMHSRLDEYFMWSGDAYSNPGIIEWTYNQLPDQEIWPTERVQPSAYTKENSVIFEAASLLHLLREMYKITKIRVAFLLVDLKRRRWGRRLSYFSLVRFHVHTWWAFRYLSRLVERDIEVLTRGPFVPFLLPREPEYTTLTLAKEFNDVFTMVRQLALSLPAGVRLVVKEHLTNVGNRSLSFYKKLAKLPNVVLADFRIPGVELAARSLGVATVSGSVGIEASLLGKPVIAFSARTPYGFMSNVHVISDFWSMPDILRNLLKESTDKKMLATKLAGAKLHASIIANSWVMSDAIELRGKGNLSEEKVEESMDHLVANWQFQRGEITLGQGAKEAASS